MIGRSRAFRIAGALIEKMSASDAPVLIEGEAGTGKELAARAIHYRGARAGWAFVPVNCGALPDMLIESELVELARGGTLFLDEVDALNLKGQILLLRFLQEQADVRIITASKRLLDRLVNGGAFQLDLFSRLKMLHLTLPPLRERGADIALLARHFVRACSARYGRPALPIDPQTLAWFGRYRWPGNIRELESLIQRHILLAEGESISIPAPPGVLPAERLWTL